MAWTTEKRYKRYEEWTQEELQQIKENIAKSPWRASYHVEPHTGLLNDPNGFSYFDGKWVVFYQNFPFGAAHGLKCWVQLESDLIRMTYPVLITNITSVEEKELVTKLHGRTRVGAVAIQSSIWQHPKASFSEVN